MCRQPAGAPAIKVAVGHERAVHRQTDLTAVGMPGQGYRHPVGRHCIQDSQVRCVRDSEGEVRIRFCRASDEGVVIASNVWVIHPPNVDSKVANVHGCTRVGQVLPAAPCQGIHQLGPGKFWPVRVQVGRSGEVLEGIDRPRGVVVVAAEDEDSRGRAEQRVESLHDRIHRIDVTEEVAGDHDKVRTQFRERGDPVLESAPARSHVQVGQMQDAHRVGVARQSLRREAPQTGRGGLPPGVSGHCRSGHDGSAEKSAGSHVGSVSCLVMDNAPMSTLKNQLQSDLTAAIRQQDEITMSTLRMALAAVTKAEVAGKTARELDDDEVVGVLVGEAKKRREAAEAFDGAGATDRADRERDELVVLERYLPSQLSEDEIKALVAQAVASAAAEGKTGPAAMGVVMKALTPQTRGRADGGVVAALVKQALA